MLRHTQSPSCPWPCRDRKVYVATLGKPTLSQHRMANSVATRNLLLPPKFPSPSSSPVATQNFLSQHGAKDSCRARTLCCRARIPLSAHRPNCALDLHTLSRQGMACRDPTPGNPIATKTSEWAVAHSGFLHYNTLFLLFFFWPNMF